MPQTTISTSRVREHYAQAGGVLRPAARFVLQFFEMCFAMCAGGLILGFAFFQGTALIGYPNLVQRAPQLSMLVLGINWALVMAVWMAFRGHAWRHNLEMSSTSIVAAILFIVAFGLGLIPGRSLANWFGLFSLQCAPSCVLMGADMLIHYRHYSGGKASR